MLDLLEKVRLRLKFLKIPYHKVNLSPLYNKKIRIFINDKIIDFGSKNSITYLEGASFQTREAYRARHSKIILKNGKRAIDTKYSPAWLSYYILW